MKDELLRHVFTDSLHLPECCRAEVDDFFPFISIIEFPIKINSWV